MKNSRDPLDGKSQRIWRQQVARWSRQPLNWTGVRGIRVFLGEVKKLMPHPDEIKHVRLQMCRR